MKLTVSVKPNPFVAELFVSIQAAFTVNVVIRLIADSEKVIKITPGTLKKGENEIIISNLQQYAAGNYRLEIKLLNGDLLQNIQLTKHTILTAL